MIQRHADPGADPLVALLVEDNPGDAELIALRLEPAAGAPSPPPVRLIRADSAAAACAALDRAAIDVVILDLTLPDARELEALHRVRAAAAGLPVIVLTGRADEALAVEALRAGAQDYILKPPPEGAALRRILRHARERERLLHELDSALRTSAVAARRWRLLAQVGSAVTPSCAPAAAIAEVARLLVPEAADCFAFYLVGDDELPAVVEVRHTDPSRAAELEECLRGLVAAAGGDGADPPGDARGDPLAEALHDASIARGAADLRRPLLEALGAASGVAVPLRVRGRCRGLILLASATDGHDSAADVDFARSLGDRVSLALEQARLFRQTERALAARDLAVGIVSHDLGNPLSTIQLCAAALLDDHAPSVDGMRQMAQIIQRSAAWMQQIAWDLVDRSSLEAGRLTLERQPVDVADAIGAVQAMFALDAEEHALEFAVESDADLPRVDADVRRLLQVLSNLLSNAMKFTPAGGRVVLSARASEDEEPTVSRPAGGGLGGVRFAVSDTGPGIPREDLDHVFDWFWHSRRQGRSGAGLGLAIAQGLVRAHHSDLQVDSRPGRGCTFSFTLPTSADGEAGTRGDPMALEPAAVPAAAIAATGPLPCGPLSCGTDEGFEA